MKLENTSAIYLKPDSGRVFAIGDIHGCLGEISTLLSFLKSDENLSPSDQIIFIGDYINKGGQSKEVVNLLLGHKKEFPSTIFLKGNHEDMFLAYLGFPSSYGDIFLRNSGEKTLNSYSIPPGLSTEETKIMLPAGHLEFFLGLADYAVTEDYIFVHGGLSPLKGINEQLPQDIFWIRNDFIQHTHTFGKTVVFGHTPFSDIWLDLPYKIGIDTGLVYKNMLSCMELKSKNVYQVKFNSSEVLVKSMSSEAKK